MGLGDTFDFYIYDSDDGVSYFVKLSDEVATAGGFVAAPKPVTAPAYPYNSKDMRHVLGVDADGHHARCPVASPTDSLFISGGNFSIHGRNYSAQSRIGERRDVRHVGG